MKVSTYVVFPNNVWWPPISNHNAMAVKDGLLNKILNFSHLTSVYSTTNTNISLNHCESRWKLKIAVISPELKWYYLASVLKICEGRLHQDV